MKFNEIRPFARYVRKLKIEENSYFDMVIPLDARIFYVMSGCGKIMTEKKKITLQPGDLIYINSGVSYQLLPGEVDYLAVNFDFTSRHTDISHPVAPVPQVRAKPEMIIETVSFSDETMFNRNFVLRNCSLLEKESLRLLSEYKEKTLYFELKTTALLTSILVRITESVKQGNNQKILNINEVVKYIHENYGDENVSNCFIANCFAFHPNYLNAEFKKVTGCTLHAYLLQTRIAASATFLECGAYSVAEVSEMCGFADANYFSKAFRKKMGCSPAEFGNHKNYSQKDQVGDNL